VGLPDYGSLGASCQLEVELDPSLAFNDTSILQQRICHLHGICRQAVQEELARRQGMTSSVARSGERRPARAEDLAEHAATSPAVHASQRQLDYVLQLARQVPAVGVAGLPRLAQHLFQKVPSELTCLEASSLIDVLKDLRGGKIAPKDAFPGAAA
jgi:hypothetical protein